MAENKKHKIYTIGHSNMPLETFLKLLKEFNIIKLIDVRSIPKSRHNPQFNQCELACSLNNAGIEYEYMPGLGGFRPVTENSVNKGWLNKSFQGYADYMQTQEFKKNLEVLIKSTEGQNTAIMCAEVLPWRCHRSLIADALTARGFEIEDIISEKSHPIHKLNKMAQIEDNGQNIFYPNTDTKKADL